MSLPGAVHHMPESIVLPVAEVAAQLASRPWRYSVIRSCEISRLRLWPVPCQRSSLDWAARRSSHAACLLGNRISSSEKFSIGFLISARSGTAWRILVCAASGSKAARRSVGKGVVPQKGPAVSHVSGSRAVMGVVPARYLAGWRRCEDDNNPSWWGQAGTLLRPARLFRLP